MDETDRKGQTPLPPGEGSGDGAAGAEALPSVSVGVDRGDVATDVDAAGTLETKTVAETPPATPTLSHGESEEPPPPPLKPVAPIKRRPSLAKRLREPDEVPFEVSAAKFRARSRRDFLLFGAGAVAAAAGLWWLLPDETKRKHLTPGTRDWLDSLEARLGANPERREKFLKRALTFDDDVAEALYSPDRSVRTYSKSQVTALRNNYEGMTPGPGYIAGWELTVTGLASGRTEWLKMDDLFIRLKFHEQVTRLCCVEGWSMVAWWGGLRFADFLRTFPPAPGARWARLDSAVNLDSAGNSDPYYVSIDLPTAMHPQTLLATHVSGRPLPVEHGAPLRLVAPMKLGLKNIKAITSIAYSAEEPADYWNERGYSKYDGL